MCRVLLKILAVPNKQAFNIPGVPILVTHIKRFLVTSPLCPNYSFVFQLLNTGIAIIIIIVIIVVVVVVVIII